MPARKARRATAASPEAAAAATDGERARQRRRWRSGWLAAGLGALTSPFARAESRVDFRLLLYDEGKQRTRVVNPELFLLQDFGERGQFGLLLSYDAISGASPTGEIPRRDATASASSAGTIPMAEYSDTRQAATASYTRRFGAHLPSVDLSYSRETDYLSRGLGVGDALDLFGGRSTLHVGAGLTEDVVSPVNMNADFRKRSRSLSLGWTQVLGPRDLFDVSAGFTALRGYLTDPYKRTPIGSLAPIENRPAARDRFALVVKYGHYFLFRGAMKLRYRYYTDDWSLRAHTGELQWDQRFGRRWIVTPSLRYYRQGAAEFFAYEFQAPQRFASSDYRLSSFRSWQAGLGVALALGERFSLNAGTTFQTQTGNDRVLPRTGVLPAVARAEEDEDGPRSVAAADLETVTATLGFSVRF